MSKIFYNAFGLKLVSFFPIPFLEESHLLSDTDIELIEDNDIRIPIKNYEYENFTLTKHNEVLFYKKGVGLFKIEDQGKILINKDKNVTNQELARVTLGLPMGYYFMLNNYLTIHGSCVNYKKNTPIFIGKSGSGKSSIAMKLMSLGANFISEDICAIDDKYECLPSFPLIKLHSDLIKEIRFDFQKKFFDFETDSLGRKGLRFDNSLMGEKKPVNIIYFLQETNTNEVRLEEIDKKKSLKLIIDNCFKPLPFDVDLIKLEEILSQCSNFVTNSLCFRASGNKKSFAERNDLILNHIHRINEQGKY